MKFFHLLCCCVVDLTVSRFFTDHFVHNHAAHLHLQEIHEALAAKMCTSVVVTTIPAPVYSYLGLSLSMKMSVKTCAVCEVVEWNGHLANPYMPTPNKQVATLGQRHASKAWKP